MADTTGQLNDERTAGIALEDLTVGYRGRPVVERLSGLIPRGQITSIVGANACGKSTLLRTIARLLTPSSGAVLLDGHAIHDQPTRSVARTLGFLPQSPTPPEGISVAELVGRGRFPHQRLGRPRSAEDRRMVAWALEATGTAELADRPLDALSGGQRQRVWIAMALAQDTPVLLLDEPTTYLDLGHQVEVLDLLARLNQTDGRTVVMVLHDLNLAARYSHHLIAMRSGAIDSAGPPAEVLSRELAERILGMRARVLPDPISGLPIIIPVGDAAP